MITVKNLKKSYGDNHVLKGLSFSIKKKEIFGLLGPNGAGKTTTLECMEGLRVYDEGEVKIKGLSPDQALKKGVIGVQLQNSSLPGHMKVKDLLTLHCYWQKREFQDALFSSFGLEKLYMQSYKNLSTGQKRTCHLALSLIADPDIIFLDEPTAGLDVEARHQLHQKILALKDQGKTIILSSHDMAEVQSLCDRVAILLNGEIHAIDSPEVICKEETFTNTLSIKFSEEPTSFTLQEASNISKKGDCNKVQVSNLHKSVEELLIWTKEQNLTITDLSIDKPSLEERFLSLAKEAKQ